MGTQIRGAHHLADRISSSSRQLLSSENKIKVARKKNNVHLLCPQNRQPEPEPGQVSGAAPSQLPQSGDLRQDVVPRCRHPRPLLARPQDRQEGVTAWQPRSDKRENSSFDVLFYTLWYHCQRCIQIQSL